MTRVNHSTLIRAAALRQDARNRGHVFYSSIDADKPPEICDGNGEVVLNMCKLCGRAEAELWRSWCPVTQ